MSPLSYWTLQWKGFVNIWGNLRKNKVLLTLQTWSGRTSWARTSRGCRSSWTTATWGPCTTNCWCTAPRSCSASPGPPPEMKIRKDLKKSVLLAPSTLEGEAAQSVLHGKSSTRANTATGQAFSYFTTLFLSAGGATTHQWVMVTSSRRQGKFPCPKILQIWAYCSIHRVERPRKIWN